MNDIDNLKSLNINLFDNEISSDSDTDDETADEIIKKLIKKSKLSVKETYKNNQRLNNKSHAINVSQVIQMLNKSKNISYNNLNFLNS